MAVGNESISTYVQRLSLPGMGRDSRPRICQRGPSGKPDRTPLLLAPSLSSLPPGFQYPTELNIWSLKHNNSQEKRAI